MTARCHVVTVRGDRTTRLITGGGILRTLSDIGVPPWAALPVRGVQRRASTAPSDDAQAPINRPGADAYGAVFGQVRWLCAIRRQPASNITKAPLHKEAGGDIQPSLG